MPLPDPAALARGMPYRVFGGVRFFQRKEVKDVLGYLRLLLNPQDVISFRRVVNMPKRGIGDQSVAGPDLSVRGYAPWDRLAGGPEAAYAPALEALSVGLAMARDPVAADPAALLAPSKLRREDVLATWKPYQGLEPELVGRAGLAGIVAGGLSRKDHVIADPE